MTAMATPAQSTVADRVLRDAAATPSGERLLPGFADPVFDAQTTFRLIMTAMANPGQILTLPDLLPGYAPAEQGVAAILLTLTDFETPLWLPPALRDSALGRAIRFHTGAPMAEPAAAAFAVLAGSQDDVPLGAFSVGEDRYPDRSATILRVCESLSPSGALRLSGPGIPGSRQLGITGPGLDSAFWRALAANHALYPVGVDLLLVSGLSIVGLPRSTRIDHLEDAR